MCFIHLLGIFLCAFNQGDLCLCASECFHYRRQPCVPWTFITEQWHFASDLLYTEECLFEAQKKSLENLFFFSFDDKIESLWIIVNQC